MTIRLRTDHIALVCLAFLCLSPIVSAQTTVTFADPGMEAAVRTALNLPTEPITDTALSALTNLNASRCGIVSVADLQYMTGLQYLDLSYNQIASLSGFPILPNLGKLNLSYNQIADLSGFPVLPNLGMLFLSHNAIRSLVPLETLTQIVWLSVAYNQLRTVSGIYASAPITHLEADYNHLDSVQGMETLQSLKWLTLSHNRIVSVQGLSATSTTTLMNLGLSHNRLASLAGLGSHNALQRLNVSYNCLQSLAELGTPPNLNWLSVAGNGLTSLADLPSLPTLLEIDASCNSLTTISGLAQQPVLLALEARYNRLQGLSSADPPPTLMYLGGASNEISTLAGLEDYPNLTHLDVSFNSLTSFAGFPDFSGITTLVARGNQITGTGSLVKAIGLKTLDLAANQIASMSSLAAIASLYVNTIDLSYNQILSVDEIAAGPTLRVENLDISHNQITSISSAAAAASIYLQKLDVSGNLLTAVSGLAAAKNLYSLDISNNQVTDISPLGDREWNSLGLANNPTGNVQTVLFKNGKCPTQRVTIGPGQLANLTPFQNASYRLAELYATGTEYSNISPIINLGLNSLRLENAGIYYTARIAEMQRAKPLSMLGLRGNNIVDLSGLTSLIFATYIDISSNSTQSLRPLVDREDSVALQWRRHFFPQTLTGTFEFSPPYLEEYALERFGLSPEEAHQRIAPEPVVDITGTPAATTAQAGLLRDAGTKIITDGMGVYCSTGCLPAESMVPDLIGMPLDAAQATVLAAGLTIADIATICSDTVPLNITLSQDPAAGTFVAQGSGVAFTISSGPCTIMVAVPDVTGMTQEAAKAALQSAGLQLGAVTQQCNNAVPVDSVISQDPVVGTELLQGSSVALLVSSGTCLADVIVPDVSGLDRAAAEAALSAEGLVLGVVTEQYNDTVVAGVVFGQQPRAGTSALHGTAVDLVVSLGPAPVEGEGEGEGESEGEPEGEGEPHAYLVERTLNLYNNFTAADTNGDGLLSFDEAVAAEPGLTVAQFAELDTNGDGGVGEEELAQYLGLNLPEGCGGGAGGFVQSLITLGVIILSILGLTVLDHWL